MLRFVLVALSATALGSADETDDLISVDTGSTGQSINLPSFTPATIGAPFLEQFADELWSERWTPSTASSGEEGMEEMNYVGRWAREQPYIYKGMENDYGLVLKDDARRHAISAPFKSSIDNKDKTLVLQYEVKMQKGLECGGAYLKLLTVSPVGIQAQQFSGDTPYTIMFGPDKCGATNKVHFIFRHFNPVSKKYEEKHLSSPPVAKISKLSTLYTLIVHPDQTFEIKINDKSVKRGSLLEDFTPAVTPAKNIDDPEDKKPADWVDEARIADPEATKPEDWDEDAPFEIPDPDAVKPDGWLDDEPDLVSDPDASKPDDWDDEEDGTWIAPKVPNPKCTDGPGCGEWEAPMVKNPAYKGKWFAPKIDNPAYKGIWEPRKISNPDYYEDLTPSNFEPMSGIGFELWTMQGDILFDNILVSHDETDAAELAKDWKTKFAVEEAEDNAAAPKATDEAREKYGQPVFAEDPLGYVTHRFQQFVSIAQIDPFYALKDMPDVAGGILAGIVTLFVIIGSMLSLFTPKSESVKSRTPKSQKVLEVVPSNDVAPPIVADTAEIASTSDVDSGATTTRARSATKKA